VDQQRRVGIVIWFVFAMHQVGNTNKSILYMRGPRGSLPVLSFWPGHRSLSSHSNPTFPIVNQASFRPWCSQPHSELKFKALFGISGRIVYCIIMLAPLRVNVPDWVGVAEGPVLAWCGTPPRRRPTWQQTSSRLPFLSGSPADPAQRLPQLLFLPTGTAILQGSLLMDAWLQLD
jgi:hypothetical protein